MGRLIVVSKGFTGVSHEPGDGWITIGRADSNVFQIIESSVSGRHCQVRVQGNAVVVRDLLSTNGTFIQGRRITEAMLKPGQMLRLGNVELRLEPSVAPELSEIVVAPSRRTPTVPIVPFSVLRDPEQISVPDTAANFARS